MRSCANPLSWGTYKYFLLHHELIETSVLPILCLSVCCQEGATWLSHYSWISEVHERQPEIQNRSKIHPSKHHQNPALRVRGSCLHNDSNAHGFFLEELKLKYQSVSKNYLIETLINCDTLADPKLCVYVFFSYLNPGYLFLTLNWSTFVLLFKKTKSKLTGTILLLLLLLDKNWLKFWGENCSFQCKLSRQIKCYRSLEYRLEQLSLSLEGSISTNISENSKSPVFSAVTLYARTVIAASLWPATNKRCCSQQVWPASERQIYCH